MSEGVRGRATTNSNGDFEVGYLLPGTYHIIPQRFGYTFSPDTLDLTITESSLNGFEFSGRLDFSTVMVRVTDAGMPVVYVLKVSDPLKRSVLDVANAYHVHPRVQYASSNFYRRIVFYY